MNALTRFGTRAVVRPISADPTTTGAGYPWQDGDILYADDLNAAFSDSFNTISVLNHGAKGDGTTDDTAAIQAVLNTYAGKAVVFIPDTGNWYRVTTLAIHSGTGLLIDGKLRAIPSTGNVIDFTNANNVTIRGHGTIDGDGAANAGWPYVTANIGGANATNIKVSGLTSQNAIFFNFAANGCSHLHVDSVRLLTSISASGFNWCQHSWITRSYMNQGGNDDCWAFYGGCVDCGISDCETTGARVAGISVYADGAGPGGNPTYVPSQNITIANNISHHNAENGIEVRSQEPPYYIHTGIVITGNRCYANASDFDPQCADIWLSSADGVTVSGNNLSGSGSGAAPAWGIFVGNRASHVHIVGNSIWNEGQGGTSGVGIYMQVPSDVLIEGNYFYDTQTTPTMRYAIDGTAGPRCAITGNSFGLLGSGTPIHMIPVSDTVLANSTLGMWTVGAGNGTNGEAMGINAPVGYGAVLYYRSNSVPRWFVGTTGGTESGGDVGSDYAIVSSFDNGSPKVNALSINRATSVVTLNTAPRILAGLNDAPNDAAAASAGVPLGGTYRNGSVMMVRIV
jgi:hypothetical protein